MLTIINRLNSWYDSLKEPYQFSFFIFMLLASVGPLQVGLLAMNREAVLFGFTLVALLATILAVRAIGTNSKIQKLAAYVAVGLIASCFGGVTLDIVT